MAPNWRTATVAELQQEGILLVEDGNHGENRPRPEEFVSTGVSFIRAADMDDGRVLFESASKINERARKRITKGIGTAGDVLVSHKGTVGKIALVPDNAPPFVCSPQTTFWRALNHNHLDQRYLYAFLRSPGFHMQLAARAGETDMAPYVSLTSQRGLSVTLPPVAEQRAIGVILAAFDDNIELNMRRNAALEAIARALFRSWFVDFDPVHANANGMKTGLPPDVGGLFPSRFEESVMGQIPSGWRVSRLRTEAVTLLGGTPSRDTASYWGGDIPWINSGKANDFRIIEPTEFITRKGLQSSATKLLPARTTVIAITGATVGKVSLTEIETCANQSIVGVLGSRTLPSEFIYFWVKENIEFLLARQTGGAQQHINKENVNELPIVCPSTKVMASYCALARPAFDRIKEGCLESRSLAAIRDGLLPRLLTGRIRVRNEVTIRGHRS